MGTFYNVDWLEDRVPWAKVKGAPIAGWYFSGETADQPLLPWSPPSTYPDWERNKTGTSRVIVPYLVNLYKTYIHPNCADREDVRFHCGSVHVFYKHIRSPVFVLQHMYDSNQINGQLYMPSCGGDTCTQAQKDYVGYFGESFRKSTRQVVQSSKKDGLFFSSCYEHTGGLAVGGSTRINSYDPTTMLGDWYFDRGTLPRIVIDDCPGTLPCNPSCQTLVPRPDPQPETRCETELNTLCLEHRRVGCLACAYVNLAQLFKATCTLEELDLLCS